MTDSTVSNNISQYGSGGGLYLDYGDALTMSGSKVSGNKASESGGGSVQLLQHPFDHDNSTVSNNESQYGVGGGLYVASSGATTITHSTISGNKHSGIVLNASYAQVQGNRSPTISATGSTLSTATTTRSAPTRMGSTMPPRATSLPATPGGSRDRCVAGASNSIRGNAINSNGGLAIDLGKDGRTSNDPGDADYGPNNLQNYPVITSLTTGTATHVTGTLTARPTRASPSTSTPRPARRPSTRARASVTSARST